MTWQRWMARRFAIVMMIAGVGSALEERQNPGAVAAQESHADSFKIAGTVVNAVTGEALAHVRVTLANVRARQQSIETFTGEGGRFEFAGLPAGKYSLRGARIGYIAATYEEHEQFSTAIVTGPEFATEKLVLQLMPVATIAGHVLDVCHRLDAGGKVRRLAQAQQEHGDTEGKN